MLVDRRPTWILHRSTALLKQSFLKNAHLLTCHLALTAHGAVDVAACLPVAMEQLHYLLVNSSVRRSLHRA